MKRARHDLGLNGIGLIERRRAAIDTVKLERRAVPDMRFEPIDNRANLVGVHSPTSTRQASESVARTVAQAIQEKFVARDRGRARWPLTLQLTRRRAPS